MNEELIVKARAAKSAEELIALAKENGTELTREEAEEYFGRLNQSGELADKELDNVAGGGCHIRDGRLVVTTGYECKYWSCYSCGEGKTDPIAHRCAHSEDFLIQYICSNCKYKSYEKGLWLCNHPANRS